MQLIPFNNKKILIVIFLWIIIYQLSFAEEVAERKSYPSTFSTDLTIMALYPWGAVLEVGETCEVPILRFENSLTSTNSLKFRASLNLTPITLEGDFKTTFTPIAFFQLFIGAGIGTGWSFANFHGFSQNVADENGNSKLLPINGKNFFFNTRFGFRLQFDLGAIIDNEWAHFVLVMDQGLKYFGAANMTSYDSWLYRQDSGENRNSWLYTANYVLGYQMPIPLNFVGIQIETEKKLYREPEGKEKWGDQYIYAYITPLLVFKATSYLNIIIAPQFLTVKNYIYDSKIFYEHNEINNETHHKVRFYRIAISLSFDFKH